MAMYWNALESCMMPSLGLVMLRGCEVVGRTGYPVSAPWAGKLGLSAYVFVRIEDFGKSLKAQVVVPCLRKADMLLVQLEEIHIVVADDVAAPLLNGDVIVAPIPRV